MKKKLGFLVLFCGMLINVFPQSLNSNTSSPVIIDTENPVVELVYPGEGDTILVSELMTVEWHANDEHLPEFPVNIGFSVSQGGEIEWQENDFENTGSVQITPPQVSSEFAKVFVKVTDEFGNVTLDDNDGYFVMILCEDPVTIAGSDATICERNAFQLSGIAQNHGSVLWTTSGDGTFNTPGSLDAVYTPGLVDIAAGLVNLTLTAGAFVPCTGIASDEMNLQIQKLPVADAGPDFITCITEINGEIQLDGTATNGSSILWTSFGDGTFDNQEIEDPGYYPGDNDFNNDSVSLQIFAQPLQPCHTAAMDQATIFIQIKQEININAGWSGISSYIEPSDPDTENLLSDILAQIIIMYNLNNMIFYPAGNINTLQNWDYLSGYIIKVDDGALLNMCGNKTGNRTLNLNSGWNLFPVLCNQHVPVADVFAPLGTVLTVIKEIAGNNVYYPEFGIYTLSALMSGKAYLARVTDDCSITFPNVVTKSQIVEPIVKSNSPAIWGEIIPTHSSHLIIFPAPITSLFNPGDIIGAFSLDGIFAGIFTIDENRNANSLTVFGDDNYTLPVDGMIEGHPIQFKLLRSATSKISSLQVDFAPTMNDGFFTNNGISVVKSMNLVSVEEINTDIPLRIYPNPATNMVTIEYSFAVNEKTTVSLVNIDGVIVKKAAMNKRYLQLDLTGIIPGVYLVKVENELQLAVERLVVQ